MKVFIIGGTAKSGKNTFGKFLREELKKYGYKPCVMHLTEPLYSYAKNYFSWDERTDEKPREFLQKVGIEIIKENMDLLRKVGLVLGEKGKIMGPEFEEMIKENTSGTLNEERLKKAKEENSWEYYEKTLRDEKRVVMEGLKMK